MCNWITKHMGADIPLHFTAFHPDWKMRDIPTTPSSTLSRARQIGLKAGLRHVYTGNVHDRDGGTTFCPGCDRSLIVRDWYNILDYQLTDDGHCPDCGTAIAGHFEHFDKAFGAHRIPLQLHP